jgi:hypothetical protein
MIDRRELRYLSEWCESDWTADEREPVYAFRDCASRAEAQRVAEAEAQRTGIDWCAVRKQRRGSSANGERGAWRDVIEWRREGDSGWYLHAGGDWTLPADPPRHARVIDGR